VNGQFETLAAARSWRGDAPWVATDASAGLFEMEFLRHLRLAEGADIAGGGFLRSAGDEIDVLVLTLFLRDLSAEYGVRVSIRDDDNPLAKLRYLEFKGGMMPSGNALEDLLSRGVVIKKVEGQAINFYSPSHPLNTRTVGESRWGYRIYGIRAYAPTLLEAEREALKILRAMRHLDS
jgi:succinylarginine dihydrolase